MQLPRCNSKLLIPLTAPSDTRCKGSLRELFTFEVLDQLLIVLAVSNGARCTTKYSWEMECPLVSDNKTARLRRYNSIRKNIFPWLPCVIGNHPRPTWNTSVNGELDVSRIRNQTCRKNKGTPAEGNSMCFGKRRGFSRRRKKRRGRKYSRYERSLDYESIKVALVPSLVLLFRRVEQYALWRRPSSIEYPVRG